MSLTHELLMHDFASIGLRRGDVVLFHGSLSRLGHVDGGAETVVRALLEVVGPSGTVAAPTIVHTSGLPRPPFEIDSTPSEVGALTEALREHPGAVRSLHPTHSVAAVGHQAAELVRAHPDATGPWTPWGTAAFGLGSPWDRLVRWNARYLLLGVDFQVCTLFHYVQTRYLADHQPDYAQPIPFPFFAHRKMGEILKQQLGLQPGKVGAATTWLLDAQDIVRITRDVLENEPLVLAEDGQESRFVDWVHRCHGRSLTLRGGVASANFDLPDWPSTTDDTGLKARAMVIEGCGERFALVSLTILCLTTEQHTTLRRQASEQTGIPVDRIVIACTHVHSGPQTLSPDRQRVDEVVAAVSRAVCATLRQAQSSVKPIRLAVATRALAGLTRLRRVRMNDGRVYTVRRAAPSTWRSGQKPEYVGDDGELDTDLTVLRFDDAHGTPLGCLFHFTTHPISDLHGFAADWLERTLGPSFVCLPLNGAFGDVDTLFDQPFHGRFADEQLPYLGLVLSGAVLELLGRAEAMDGGELRVASTTLELVADPNVTASRTNDALDWIARAARRGSFKADMPAVRLGPLALVGIPGELASGQGLCIKKASPFLTTCPVGLTNGQVGYLMSHASRDLGGYEADTSQWALTTPGSTAQVTQAAIQLLKMLAQ